MAETEFDSTIFEQDGVVYFACVMNPAHAKDTAKEIANEIRHMHEVPRAKMRVVSTEQVRSMPFGSPNDCMCKGCVRKMAKASTLQPALI